MDVAVGVLLRDRAPSPSPAVGITTEFLVTRRRKETVYGGWWEFPGGKIEPGESPERALVRELYEEIGVDARVFRRLTCHTHEYDHAVVRLHAMLCRLRPRSAPPRALEVEACRWTTLAGLGRGDFLPANGPLLEALGAYLAGTPGDGPESQRP